MRTSIKIITLLAVAAIVFVSVSPAFAEDGTPPGRGGLTETLGLTEEELKSLRDSGMNLQEIFQQQCVEFNPSGGGRFGKLAEQCGISHDEIRSCLQAGEDLQDICPGIEMPERSAR